MERMNNFFCADYSRKIGEDIIWSDANHSIYILIECPTPWAPNAFDSISIPQKLKNLVYEMKRHQLSIQFLLIESDILRKKQETKVLIFDKEKEGLLKGYRKQEFNVETIEKVADVVSQYLVCEVPDCKSDKSKTRDILVCTHGSHDQCCARYGNPFYQQALATVSDLSLSNVRIWKASHFGGHRFAPTIIDFSEGRYYGVLDQESFKSILTRTGDIKCLNRVYGGWGILSNQLQAMERELIFQYGWDWFNYKVGGRILEQYIEKNVSQAELSFEKPDGSIYTYRAELVKDEYKTLQLSASCNTLKESTFVKYSVENLSLCLYSEPVENLCFDSKKIVQ